MTSGLRAMAKAATAASRSRSKVRKKRKALTPKTAATAIMQAWDRASAADAPPLS